MRLRSLIFCAVALTMAFACSKKNYTPESTTTTQPETPIPQPPAGDADEAAYQFNVSTDKVVLSHEFRGAWLATVSGTDWPKTKLNSSVQKAELTKDLEGIADAGCNVVFFQVCSNMDALWPSKLLPWSSVLTGTEGIDPGYDPTAFAVEKAHQLGLEIHAWINPYRIGATAKAHASLSPVKAHPELVKEYAGSHYLDPALPGTHAFLAEIATELMTKYPFDGLHIDDYFYPSGYNKDQKGWETQTYPLYGGGKDREEWRFSNVDARVKALCDATHAARPGAVFGVSPRSRSDLYLPQYADPARWARAGTIDYVVPQIYWTLERGDAAAFDTVLKSWNGLVGKVPVFAGIAAYKMEKSYYTQAKNEDFQFVEEFVRQVQVCRDASWCGGHVWFRTESILRADLNACIRKTIYRKYGSLVPPMGPTGTPPAAPAPVVDGTKVSWAAFQGATAYAVYELERASATSKAWNANLVYRGESTSYTGVARKNYAVLAIAGRNLSPLSPVVYIAKQ